MAYDLLYPARAICGPAQTAFTEGAFMAQIGRVRGRRNARLFAGPLLAVLVAADVGMGLLTKAAPTLNVFSLGFPLKIFVTISLIGVTFVAMPAALGALLDKITNSTDLVSAVFSTKQ